MQYHAQPLGRLMARGPEWHQRKHKGNTEYGMLFSSRVALPQGMSCISRAVAVC